MGRKYKRTSNRAQWNEDDFKEAKMKVGSRDLVLMRQVDDIKYHLEHHVGILKGENRKTLGHPSELGYDEKRLVKHMQTLEKVGFAPDRRDVKRMAFKFAEKLNLKHRFAKHTESAGNDWFQDFIRRNKELTIRKLEGLSLARAQGLNRSEIHKFFSILSEILNEYSLTDKPSNIYNMDEMGIQINTKPGHVVATKGSKNVYTVTSAGEGENVSIISCCSADGRFLPPVFILKGKYRKPDFLDGLPPGSDVYMNPKSSYINSELLLQ